MFFLRPYRGKVSHGFLIHDGTVTQAQGFSGFSMATTVIGAVTNIILDPILIFALKMGVAGAAYAISGARTLRSARTIGVTVQMMGGILGLLIMLALAIVGAEYLLTPENLLLYELVWMIPALMITEWTRTL